MRKGGADCVRVCLGDKRTSERSPHDQGRGAECHSNNAGPRQQGSLLFLVGKLDYQLLVWRYLPPVEHFNRLHGLLLPRICEESTPLGAALRTEDGQLQDVAHGRKNLPEIMLAGLCMGGDAKGGGGGGIGGIGGVKERQ